MRDKSHKQAQVQLKTLPTAWPFPRTEPKPLTKKQLQELMFKEAQKALF